MTPPGSVTLDEGLFVGPELDPRGIEKLSHAGFRAIVNVAEEGEPGQILSPNVEATWAHTFELAHVRHSVGAFPEREDVERLSGILAELPRPIYLHATREERALGLGLAAVAQLRGWSLEQALREAESLAIDSRSLERLLAEVLGADVVATGWPELGVPT